MNKKHPDREKCMKMLKDYKTPEHVIKHCEAVTGAALKLAGALNKEGFNFDLQLIEAAGLLHDIARVDKKHWVSGADFVKKNGYIKEAGIIRKHMDHSLDPDTSKLKELDIICLGDRLILEDTYAGLDARMDYVIKKAEGDEFIINRINKNREINRKLIKNIEKIIGKTIEEVINGI